jgi:hypothetical protein
MEEEEELDSWPDLEEAWRRQDHLAGAAAGGRRLNVSGDRAVPKACERVAGRN